MNDGGLFFDAGLGVMDDDLIGGVLWGGSGDSVNVEEPGGGLGVPGCGAIARPGWKGLGAGLRCGGDVEDREDDRDRIGDGGGMRLGRVSARSTIVLNEPTNESQDISLFIVAPAATIVRAIMA